MIIALGLCGKAHATLRNGDPGYARQDAKIVADYIRRGYPLQTIGKGGDWDWCPEAGKTCFGGNETYQKSCRKQQARAKQISGQGELL